MCMQYSLRIESVGMIVLCAKLLQSCPTLCDSWIVAHQAPLSTGFSRHEHWSGLPFPSPMQESEKWKWSRSVVSCLTLNDPMDCSLPGSSTHGIFQATVLEWGAIAFSLPYHRSQLTYLFTVKIFMDSLLCAMQLQQGVSCPPARSR